MCYISSAGETLRYFYLEVVMARAKPLVLEEVPEEYRNRVHFDTQFMSQAIYPGRVKNVLKVWVDCSICQRQNDVPVNDVRNFINGVRKVFPGDHRGCKYPGRTTHTDGYSLIWMPDHPNANGNRYVAEHLYVMSEHLGRPVDTKTESVHHINGDKSDNRLENLQLRKVFHGKGQVWECQDCGSHNVSAVALKD